MNFSKLLMVCASSFFVFSATGNAASAKDKGFGIGFVLGDPTAISAKWFNSNEKAFDLQVSVNGQDYVAVWGDFLFQSEGIFGKTDGYLSQFGSYVGFGPIVVIPTKDDHARGNYFDERDDDFALGARIPFGFEWFWQKAPLAVGFELAPGIIVAPTTIGVMQGGLTLRFYF